MGEDTTCYCVSGSFESWNGLNPFGKVIYFDDNVLVFIIGWRMTSDEVYDPFIEGSTMMIGCKRVWVLVLCFRKSDICHIV
jgi:hypothetical protein